MKRAKKLFLYFLLFIFFLFFFIFSPRPDAKLCTALAMQSLQEPRYYDLAVKVGCSKRQIVNALNLSVDRDSNFIRRFIQGIVLSL